MRASSGEAVVVMQTASSAPISVRKLPTANSRSGSAASATLTLPKWKCPSSIASTSWLRCLRRRGGASRPDRLPSSCTSASVAVRPVRRSNTVHGTPQRACSASAAGRICSPMASVCAEPPICCSAVNGVPPIVVPSQSSGMWPSSEPETSGTNTASSPKASMISRSSSMSPGVRWLPGSTVTRRSQRGVSTRGTWLTSVVTAFAQPSWNAPR